MCIYNTQIVINYKGNGSYSPYSLYLLLRRMYMTKKVKDTKAMKLTPKIMEELGFYLDKETYDRPLYISTLKSLRVIKHYSLNDIKKLTLGELIEEMITHACKEVEWETKKKMREALGLNF